MRALLWRCDVPDTSDARSRDNGPMVLNRHLSLLDEAALRDPIARITQRDASPPSVLEMAALSALEAALHFDTNRQTARERQDSRDRGARGHEATGGGVSVSPSCRESRRGGRTFGRTVVTPRSYELDHA